MAVAKHPVHGVESCHLRKPICLQKISASAKLQSGTGCAEFGTSNEVAGGRCTESGTPCRLVTVLCRIRHSTGPPCPEFGTVDWRSLVRYVPDSGQRSGCNSRLGACGTNSDIGIAACRRVFKDGVWRRSAVLLRQGLHVGVTRVADRSAAPIEVLENVLGVRTHKRCLNS